MRHRRLRGSALSSGSLGGSFNSRTVRRGSATVLLSKSTSTSALSQQWTRTVTASVSRIMASSGQLILLNNDRDGRGSWPNGGRRGTVPLEGLQWAAPGPGGPGPRAPRRRHGMPLAAHWLNNSKGILKLADTRPRNLKPRWQAQQWHAPPGEL